MRMQTHEEAVKSSDLDWEPAQGYPRGTLRKVLRRSAEGEPRTALMKLPPGFEMESHSHIYAEHHYVVEGEYRSGDESFERGSYRMIPPHADHGPFRSEAGAEVLVIWVD
jgi:anti-sigma factor ChrR (cupin superfamily)